MFQIIQSNDTDELVNQLVNFYEKNEQVGGAFHAIFRPFTVIVPSMVLGDWLTKQVALKSGISTLLTAQFWGQYQWRMIDTVLKIDAQFHDDALAVPEVAVLSGSVMRWRIFGFLSQIIKTNLAQILDDESDVLHFLFKPLADTQIHVSPFGETMERPHILEQRLWQACDELAKVYVKYLTHRPEWLHAWGAGVPLPTAVDEMIRQKDKFGDSFGQSDETPEWLFAHYESLEKLLRFLWQALFCEIYDYRERLEERFWQVLDGERGEAALAQVMRELPKALHLFTVQQIPQIELMFLKRLSLKIDIHLLHFNPSKMFWADIVDKNWLLTQKIIKPQMVYLKDYGHGLLSRLAKESRETFAMLADMSGGEFYYENVDKNHDGAIGHDSAIKIDWQDKFVEKTGDDILSKLKQDILTLGEDESLQGVAMAKMLEILSQKTHQKPTLILNGDQSDSLPELSIHACHSLKRQLEIARTMIAKYLNTSYQDGTRQLSDVVILLPDVQESEAVIRSVFPDGVGVDGLYLPIKITGTTDRTIDGLMQAIVGVYRLGGARNARFYADEFYEWLMNPAVYENFGLSFDDAYRAKSLLTAAGFKRGLNAWHLDETLHANDTDYRYTFSYALDRIVMGFVSPDTTAPSDVLYPLAWQNPHDKDATLALDGIGLNDAPIVDALCRMYEALIRFSKEYCQIDSVKTWLDKIEKEVIDGYFYRSKQSVQMRAIFEAKNAMLSSLRANTNYHKRIQNAQSAQDDIRLSLEFVLESLSEMVGMQAIAAEPSGVITVARFGALRSIPFGLTLMLGMNISSFPHQDKSARLDLMKAGLKRRGDRNNEDDDNGAFLDALLCAKDACAIFYDGMSADGSTMLLPAGPVGELLEFLKTDVHWQWAGADGEMGDVQMIGEILPSLIERYLVTYHHAMSFEEGVFYEKSDKNQSVNKTTESMSDYLKAALTKRIDDKKRAQKIALPPSPIWQNVRQIIDNKENFTKKSLITLPSDNEIARITKSFRQNASASGDDVFADLMADYQLEMPSYLKVQALLRAIKNPAEHYLRGKFAIEKADDDDDADEPLSLDGLGNWRLNQMILAAFGAGGFDGRAVDVDALLDESNHDTMLDLKALQHDSLLPAGVVKKTALQDGLDFISGRFASFFEAVSGRDLVSNLTHANEFSKMLTHTSEGSISLEMGKASLKILGSVPSNDEKIWLNMIIGKPSDDKLIGFWVHHLLWQIYRGTSDDDVGHGRGASVWQYQANSPKSTDSAQMYEIAPITADVAKKQLQNLAMFALLGAKIPLFLTPSDALGIVSVGGDVSKAKTKDEWILDELDELLPDTTPKDVLSVVGRLAMPLYALMLDKMAKLEE